MKIKVRFCKEGNDVIAVFAQDAKEKRMGQRGCYTWQTEHSHGQPEYFAKLKAAKLNEYGDLLRHLVGRGYDNLQITNRQKFTAHRPPTEGEIRFGHGATHYRDFTAAQIGVNDKGQLKRRFKAADGLIYSLR